MKQRKNLPVMFRNGLVSLLAVVLIAPNLSCSSRDGRQQVIDAYTLRINAQADSASKILKQVSEEHPELAMAWYELSRATLHMGLQNPRNFMQVLDSADHCIGRAIELEPGNALYRSFKGGIETLRFYIAMQTGDSLAGEYLARVEDAYKSVFELDPGFYENKITLVEFFGMLPAEMGGDREKAEMYTRELEEADLVSGAKAREILMPDDADYEAFWKGINEKAPDNADAVQALGRVYLFNGDFEKASKCFEDAIGLDPSKNFLYLDLGRYQLMQAMQDPAALDSVAPMIQVEFDKFLNAKPEPYNTQKAWTYGMLAMISRRTGNTEESDAYLEKATQLDPYFSRSFGRPGIKLFCPPDVVIHEQGYYMTPF